MDWINEYILVSDFKEASRVTNDHVDAVICLTGEVQSKYHVSLIDHIHYVPLLDCGEGNSTEKIKYILQIMSDYKSQGKKMLVHCFAGRSRSIIIVAMHFIQQGLFVEPEDALSFIRKRREFHLSPGIDALFELSIAY